MKTLLGIAWTIFVLTLLLLLPSSRGPLPAVATTGDVLDTITSTPSPSKAGRGLTFDGDHLWYTAKTDTNLYRMSLPRFPGQFDSWHGYAAT
ncbi:MAG: hypothetical protein WD904_07980, partial [Dehalococcoidia bacterium]